MASRMEFPSPYEDFVFQQHRGQAESEFRGHTFPSPYGDFVFQPGETEQKIIVFWFPSPYGDFVFQHANRHYHLYRYI